MVLPCYIITRLCLAVFTFAPKNADSQVCIKKKMCSLQKKSVCQACTKNSDVKLAQQNADSKLAQQMRISNLYPKKNRADKLYICIIFRIQLGTVEKK